MRRAVLYFALVAACSAVAKPLGVFPWHLSGNDFVVQVSGQPGVDKWHQSPAAAYQQRYAEGYQAGVVDATQGRLWCAPQPVGSALRSSGLPPSDRLGSPQNGAGTGHI